MRHKIEIIKEQLDIQNDPAFKKESEKDFLNADTEESEGPSF